MQATRWKQLPTQSTPGLIHVESLAIDPRTADTIYAGTFILPYKSVDGGQSWKSIKNGIIDDSDIFAIDIDPRDPESHHCLRLQRHLRKQERGRQLAKGAGHSFAVAPHSRHPATSICSRNRFRRHDRRFLEI